ncbi:MAG: DUF515 domain-containing protein [Methanobrevibacter sp.]|jgi:hypothetical protein|nr:DUF515 domain-containing protein [Candidatus Methanovirga basalitermitum]
MRKKFKKINNATDKFKESLKNVCNILNKDNKEDNLNKKENKAEKNFNLKFLKNNDDEIKEDNEFKNNNEKSNDDKYPIFLRENISFNKYEKDKSDFINRKKSLNINKENKTIIGGVVFSFIILTLIFSAYFFFIYSPFSDELKATKVEKLNELNSLYKGPLAVNDKVISLRSEINNAKSPEEVKLIDILQPATISWREYHDHQINTIKDDYGRVMIKYLTNDSRSILLSVDDGHLFVNANDANILSKLNFIKPDTIIVPVSLSRLQAGGGLISVGSSVDIYFSSNEDHDKNSGNNISTTKTNDTSNDSSFQYSSYNSQFLYSDENPSISGAVVVAIMLSKNNGIVNGNYLKSQKSVDGNLSNLVENEESFSTDVEEILKSIAAGGFNEEILGEFLNNFGLKLSDYERVSNIAELDSKYLALLEIPRNDVYLLINNMDNMRITIPTNKAPNWVANELKNKYKI